MPTCLQGLPKTSLCNPFQLQSRERAKLFLQVIQHTSSSFYRSWYLVISFCSCISEWMMSKSTNNFPWKRVEKCLINLLSCILFLDQLGNIGGIVAMGWGFSVILGSLFNTLSPEDCWYSTVAMSIETIRVYSTVADQEFFFSTTGGLKTKRMFRTQKLPHLLAIALCLPCLIDGLEILLEIIPTQESFKFLIRVVSLSILSMLRFPKIVKFMFGHRILQLVPLLLVGSYAILLRMSGISVNFVTGTFVGFSTGYLIVLIMEKDLSQCHFIPSYIKKVFRFIFRWKGLISLSVLLFECVFMLMMFGYIGLGIIVGAMLIGNIQVPMGLARIALAYKRLSSLDYHNTPPNVLPFIVAFYVAVGSQGVIYCFTCILETTMSHFFRQLLAYKLNLTSRKGLKSIDFFYKDTYNVAKQKGIRAERNMDIVSYALDSLNSKNDKRQIAALDILHSVLEILSAPSTAEASRTELVSRITTSSGAINELITIMRFTEPHFKAMRVITAQIVTHIGGYVELLWNHGLLDALHMLLNEDCDVQKMTTVDISGTDEPRSASARICKFLKDIFLPLPNYSDPTHQDSLPLLGMIALERMAGCPYNCSEINKNNSLIQKVVYHMSYATDQNLMISALALVSKLANCQGEVGVELRQSISRIPFLICGLVKKLDSGYNEKTAIEWKLAVTIFAALSSDDEARASITGSEKRIIKKCLHAFNVPSLSLVACQVLCNLSWDDQSNIKLIWKTNSNELFGILVDIMKGGEYSAANMLERLLFHSRYDKEVHNVLQWISTSHFHSVLEFIKNSIEDGVRQIEANNIQKGKKMEALIGLAAELGFICYVRHLNHMTLSSFSVQGCFDLSFLQHLMIILRKSNSPVIEYPRLRKVVLNLIITLLQSSSEYAYLFRGLGLLKELESADDASFEVETYRVFCGTKGVVADKGPSLNELVVTARGSLGVQPGPSEFHSLDGGSEDEIYVDP